MKQPLTGRTDLLRILTSEKSESLSTLVANLGYQYIEPLADAVDLSEHNASSIEKTERLTDEPSIRQEHPELPETPFWRVTASEIYSKEDQKKEEVEQQNFDWPEWENESEPFSPELAPWRAIEPRLHRELASSAHSSQLDIGKTVRQLSRGELLSHFPRLARRRWGCEVQVIVDRSPSLIPYWKDQIALCAELERLFPAHAVEYAIWRQGYQEPVMDDAENLRYRLPKAGSLVIAVGDMGLLASPADSGNWIRLGMRLQQNKCSTVALLPAVAPSFPPALRRAWKLVNWEQGKTPEQEFGQLDAQLKRLLVLVSPATRIERGFLRQVRCLIGTDAAMESRVWEHPILVGKCSQGATMNPRLIHQLRKEFADDESETIQRQLLALLRGWRTHQPAEVWFEEILSLPPKLWPLLPEPDDIAKAFRFLNSLGKIAISDHANEKLQLWFSQSESRLPEHLWANEKLKPALQRLWAFTHRHDNTAVPPIPGYDPRYGRIKSDSHERDIQVLQYGGHLVVKQASYDFDESLINDGSLFGQLKTRNGEFSTTILPDKPLPSFWASGQPPSWADAWGEDNNGRWVEFVVNDVRQRMRWIPPGEFLMGSPEDEAERYDDEGPQHRVALSSGYWMFDTAVPQALWVAVMGENPSCFNGDELPVEQVSWEGCQKFVGQLNDRLHGLDLDLPSEAQWEYACRAGTKKAYSFGQEISDDLANYGYKLKKTVEVDRYRSNPWGLYQMHGNVWEWCLDGLRDYGEGREVDPLGSQDGVDRVLRGGSWIDSARDVRAAPRHAYAPDSRSYSIGFRCARVQVKTSPAAEPIEPGQLRSGTRSADPDQSGVAVDVQPKRVLLKAAEQRVAWPVVRGAFELRSDMGRLLIAPLTKPEWAKAVGRDQFGLWAEFAIEKDGKKVRQRMRWIPPGQFLMGSPDDEKMRDDDEQQHLVRITKGYWLFDTQVRQELWNVVMDENPSNFQGEELPVDSVSWNHANSFMEKMNDKVKGLNLSLPSEAQWEYACRAGTTAPFHFGDQITPDQANYDGNYPYADGQKGEYRKKTVPVKSFVPNDWGLWQMHGNVWEWCLDGRRTYGKEAESDPLGELNGVRRVLRGGSWFDYARRVRAAYRNAFAPDSRFNLIGFRCARVQDAER